MGKTNLTDRRTALSFVIPSCLIIFGVVLFPLVVSFAVSLFKYIIPELQKGCPFIGLGNYKTVLRTEQFWGSAWHTVYFTVVSVGLEFFLGMGMALILNCEFKCRALVRSVIILPWAVPTIVNGTMWKWIYDGHYGVLNSVLYQLGLIEEYRRWLATGLSAMNCVIVADVWNMTPFVVLFLLAGLQIIPNELYEAARVDGASRWQSFLRITVPFLKPTILIVLVLRTMQAFRVFDIIYVLTKGGPANATQVLSYLTYQRMLDAMNFGEGAALAYIITVCILVMATFYIRLLYSRGEE